jgi:hypothetical protein
MTVPDEWDEVTVVSNVTDASGCIKIGAREER